jgi:cell pole-organizing protein PopZ
MSDSNDVRDPPQQEPSMEDILASIRRILSEDGAGNGPAPAAFALRDAPKSHRNGRPGADDAEGVEIELMEAEGHDGPLVESNVFHLTPDMRLPPERQVLSRRTAIMSTDILSQLAKAILDRRDIAVGTRDLTIEGLIREMLRPLLKEWLDRNLPYLIERLVKKEIDLMVNRAERLED